VSKNEQKKKNSPNENSSIKQLMIDGQLYTFLPIDVAIKYHDKIKSGFFVPLNETKRVRIELDEGDVRSKMESYRDKGLENILFAEDDYDLFLQAIKRGLTGFFMKGEEGEEPKALNFQQIQFLVRKSIIYVGLEEKVANLGEENLEKFLHWMKSSKKLSPLFKNFLKENQDQFIINLFASYVGLALAEALNWPPHLGEKITQASLLGDLCLSEKDYFSFIVSNGDREKWTENYRNHPLIMSKALQKNHANSISREVVRAVEQHQEFPDGSGYPSGLRGLSIDQLSAILIVARTFTDALVESNFAYDDRKGFVEKLLEEKFDYANFKNPTKALYIIMGIEEDDKGTQATGS
jgi:hypothetical protein